MKKKAIKVTRERAIQIAMNHNGISRGMAERYTDSELREVLRQELLHSASPGGSAGGRKESCQGPV